MSTPNDTTVEFETALSTFTISIKDAMDAALVCSVLAIEHYAENDNLNWCQKFLDAMPKNFTRRAAFLKWLAAHSPILLADGKLTKDKAADAVKFNLESAIAKPFWDFAPDLEDVVLTDADAFKRLMVAVKYFRRDNVKVSDRIKSLVDGIETLVDTNKAHAEQGGSDEVVIGQDGDERKNISDLDRLPEDKAAAIA